MTKRTERSDSLSDEYPGSRDVWYSRSRDVRYSRSRDSRYAKSRGSRYAKSREERRSRDDRRSDNKERRKRRRRSRDSSNREQKSRDHRHRSRDKKSRDRQRKECRETSEATGAQTSAVQNTEEGHLIYTKGDILNDRYVVRRQLGEGTFGKVLLCKDTACHGSINGEETGKPAREKLAVKIIRNVPKYRDAAKIEIEILSKIRKADHLQGCVEMLDWFNYHGHVCIVFELLGKSVFDFLKDNGFTGFPMFHIQRIAEDLCYSLKFLHSIRYTHTDLKPENILFVDSDYDTVYDEYRGMSVRCILNPAIKVIDFGSATHEKEHHSRIVSTRHYRAPEVVCEIGWSYPCDMWSVGCILFELYTGHTLFQTHDNREHLAMMEYIMGPIPSSICKQSNKKYFRKDRLDFNKHGSSARYIRKYCKRLRDYQTESSHSEFFHLLEELLQYETDKRLTASEALKHPFFDMNLSNRETRSYKSR